jgi:hypothetical protein
MRLDRVKGFRGREIGRWSRKHLAGGAHAVHIEADAARERRNVLLLQASSGAMIALVGAIVASLDTSAVLFMGHCHNS